MRRRAAITAVLCLAAAGAGVAALAAGFGGTAGVPAGRPVQPPASSAPLAGPAAHPAVAGPARSGRPSLAAGADNSDADNSKRRASASPAPTAHAGGRGGATTPRWGIYVDAREASPHYVLSVARTGPGVIKGAVNYLYPGGATFVGQYSGTVSRDGRITMRFGAGTAAAGSTVAGVFRDGHLTLASCASVLPRAARPAGCTFTYNGNVSD
ncbi:MAG TPA: hypothetical protein VGG25_02880 [Streptosporangiaceae bacterium]